MRSPMVEVVCWTSSKTARWLYMATMLPSLNVQMHPLIAKRIFRTSRQNTVMLYFRHVAYLQKHNWATAVPARSAMSPDSGIGRSRLAPRQHLRLLRSLQVRRAEEPNLQPSAMPNPIVNIVNPPAAPDPTGMAAALSLLATPNIFRDMSGLQEVSGLLQKLAEGTISLEEASNRAQQLQQRAGSSQGGAGGVIGQPSPQEQQGQLQVYRNAEEHGELTPLEHKQIAGTYLQNAQYKQTGGDRGPSGDVFSSEGTLGPTHLDNIQRGRILFANFAVNSTDLTPEHTAALDQLIESMQESPEAYIESIAGHASQTGPEDNNDVLASGRANVVAQYLIASGFSPERIGQVIGYGSRAPLQDSPDVEIDVNRSALLTYSMLVDWPENAMNKPSPRQGGSREWAIRLQLSGGAGIPDIPIGGAFAIGELRKGGAGGEVRSGSFQGFGLAAGAATPGSSLGEAQWTRFTTDAPYDF